MSELTQRVRAKYPGVYDDLSDADLEKAVLAKHPEYADLAGKTEPIHGKVQSDNPAEMIQQPTTFMGGFAKSILDQMGVGDPNSALSHAARPQTVGDVGSLLLPSSAAGQAVKSVPQIASEAKGIAAPIVRGAIRAGGAVADVANPDVVGMASPRAASGLRLLSRMRDAAAAKAAAAAPAAEQTVQAVERGPVSMSYGASTPLKFMRVVPESPNIASVEAAAPAAQVSQSSIPSLASLKPTLQEINPADMPRDWHAFEDATSRAAGDPVEKAQASRLHQEIMDANQRYRNSTVDERAAFKANPPSVQDLLVALLKGPKS